MAFIEKQQILKDLEKIDDIKGRFAYIIDFGKAQPSLSEEEKIEDNIIRGCNSLLWLVSSLKDGKVYFRVDSDAGIPKGLGAIIGNVYSGLTPNEILTTNTDFLSDVGIQQHLSMNRRNGLSNILKQINYYAVAYSALVT